MCSIFFFFKGRGELSLLEGCAEELLKKSPQTVCALRNVTFLNPTSRLKLTGKSVENLPFYLGSCSSSVEYNSFLYEFTAHQPSEIDNLVQVQQAQLFRMSEVWENYKQDKNRCCSLSDLCWQGLLSYFQCWTRKMTFRSQSYKLFPGGELRRMYRALLMGYTDSKGILEQGCVFDGFPVVVWGKSK